MATSQLPISNPTKHPSTNNFIIQVLSASFSNASMMPYSMPMTVKTFLRQNKSCKRHLTLSAQPTCTERHARNGNKKETPTKHGQISNVALPLSITRYVNNSVYQATQDSIAPSSPMKLHIWKQHLKIWR